MTINYFTNNKIKHLNIHNKLPLKIALKLKKNSVPIKLKIITEIRIQLYKTCKINKINQRIQQCINKTIKNLSKTKKIHKIKK